jgi:hypothetical protein
VSQVFEAIIGPGCGPTLIYDSGKLAEPHDQGRSQHCVLAV